MAEYIERESLIKDFQSCGASSNLIDAIVYRIKLHKIADVEPVRYGHWIHTDYAIHWTAKDECSECTYHTCDRDDLSEYNYCPNCGAKMVGESDEK